MIKQYKVIGSYRGCDDEVVNVLVGGDGWCVLGEGMNGDFTDEWIFRGWGIDDVVEKGIEKGIWRLEGDVLIENVKEELGDSDLDFINEMGGVCIGDDV